ncbi:MAG: potassium transporter TrkG, partial [Candidatus Nanohaloarchaea archaeon]
FGFSPFNAATHALATMPTGGFSSVPDLTAVMTPGAKATLTLFMFLGGTNFLLIYSAMQGNVMRMFRDFEFRLYLAVPFLAFLLVAADLVVNQGMSTAAALETGLFHVSSVVSSTGFELVPIRSFPELSRSLFLVLMFIGGSLGSTTGGIKMLRLGLMLKVVSREVKAIGLPPSVMNLVTVGNRIVRNDELVQVAAIIFAWMAAVVAGGVLIVALSPYTTMESVQVMVSAVGTMGRAPPRGESCDHGRDAGGPSRDASPPQPSQHPACPGVRLISVEVAETAQPPPDRRRVGRTSDLPVGDAGPVVSTQAVPEIRRGGVRRRDSLHRRRAAETGRVHVLQHVRPVPAPEHPRPVHPARGEGRPAGAPAPEEGDERPSP